MLNNRYLDILISQFVATTLLNSILNQRLLEHDRDNSKFESNKKVISPIYTLTLSCFYSLLEEKVPLKINMLDHLDEVADEVMVRIQNTVFVDETKQLVATDHMINIDVPDVQIVDLPKSIHSSKPFEFTVKFQNPIDLELTDCELFIDGNIITDRKEFKNIG